MSLLDKILVNKNVYLDNIYEKLLFITLIIFTKTYFFNERFIWDCDIFVVRNFPVFPCVRDSHPWLTNTPKIHVDNAL